jgi:hypothetical protein
LAALPETIEQIFQATAQRATRQWIAGCLGRLARSKDAGKPTLAFECFIRKQA